MLEKVSSDSIAQREYPLGRSLEILVYLDIAPIVYFDSSGSKIKCVRIRSSPD
jgi:hypothetical protein